MAIFNSYVKYHQRVLVFHAFRPAANMLTPVATWSHGRADGPLLAHPCTQSQANHFFLYTNCYIWWSISQVFWLSSIDCRWFFGMMGDIMIIMIIMLYIYMYLRYSIDEQFSKSLTPSNFAFFRTISCARLSWINDCGVLRGFQWKALDFLLVIGVVGWVGMKSWNVLKGIAPIHCMWVCLKIGYIPNYSHLIGIMIINHWV